MCIRDRANVFNTLVTRRQLIRGEPTSISAAVGVDDRLKMLAAQFERFAAAKEVEQVSPLITDIDSNGDITTDGS